MIGHRVAALVRQRVFGIAPGCEDLDDHDDASTGSPRHDPLTAVLAGELEARREDCASVAGKSTLNRFELPRDALTKFRRA